MSIKQKGKRILASLLAASMLGATMAACNKKGGSSVDELLAMEPTPTTGVVNEFGWEMPKETIDISFYFALQSSTSDNEKYNKQMHDYILEKFNVNLNKIVYDTDPTERMNLMRASDDYPDVIIYLNGNQVNEWSSQGKALPLEDLMKKNAPEFYQKFEDYVPRFRSDDGKLYQLGICWGNLKPEKNIPLADTAPSLRLDWYEEIGSPDVSTPDGYYEAIKQMVANHPTTPQGKKTYGISFYNTKSEVNVVPSFVSYWGSMYGLRQGVEITPENDYKYWLNSDKGLELIKYMNRFHREGLLDPDGLTMTAEEWSEKAIDERYAAFLGPWWFPGFYASDHWLKLKGDQYPPKMRYTFYDVKDPSIEKSTYNPKSTFGNGRVIITDKCKNPADVMRWLNFENTTLGTKLIGYGIPNLPDSVWTINEKGEYAFVPEKVEQITADIPVFDFEPFMLIGGDNNFQISSSVEMMEDGSNCWFNQSNKDQWKELKDENLKDSIYDNTAMSAIVLEADNPLTSVRQRCADIATTGFAKAIAASTEEECVAIFNQTRDEANKAGLQDVEAFYTEQYKANVEKFKVD